VRREWPFARADLPDYPPFWVASRLADIREVASRNTEFLSGQGGLLSHDQLASERRRGAGQLFRSIVVMNEPEHAKYRALTQSWFQRAPLRRFEAKIRDLARRSVARIGELGSEFDFAQEIAAHYPLLVILAILGVPEADEPFLLRLTREYFGNADAELSRGQTARSGVEALATTRAVIEEATKYFSELAAERRRAPRDDLASVVANSSIVSISRSCAISPLYIQAKIHDTGSRLSSPSSWRVTVSTVPTSARPLSNRSGASPVFGSSSPLAKPKGKNHSRPQKYPLSCQIACASSSVLAIMMSRSTPIPSPGARPETSP